MLDLTAENQIIEGGESFIINSIDSSGSALELERVKSFIQRIFSEGGYIKSSSAQSLDPWSKWIYLTSLKGEIISAQRIVEKNTQNKITIEQAFISGEEVEKHYSVEEKNVADWNSVAFENSKRGLKAAFINSGCIARYCIEKKFELVFGFSNTKKRGIERLYLAYGAEFSQKYSKPVFFPSDSLEGESFDLKIIEIKKTTLLEIGSKL